MATEVVNVPRYEADLFSDDALDDPYPHFRALRDAGPLAWLPAHGMYAAIRYEEVRRILGDPATFVSGEGVALNDVINSLGRGTTLMSDGEEHRRQREIIGRPLTPRSLADLRPDAQAIADTLVDRLVGRRHFDAVTDLAEMLPATWVPDFLGWPADGRRELVDWAAAQFDGFGPLNDRAVAASDGILAMSAYAQRLAELELPVPSFGAGIQRAADRGEIGRSLCPMLFIDYLAPSLDTTISALGNAVWLFATHPDQWQILQKEPDRIKAAFNEVLRIESPITSAMQPLISGTVFETIFSYHADTVELGEMATRAGVPHVVLTHLIPPPEVTGDAEAFAQDLRNGGYQGRITVGEDLTVISF
jgi:cytochrome P450